MPEHDKSYIRAEHTDAIDIKANMETQKSRVNM